MDCREIIIVSCSGVLRLIVPLMLILLGGYLLRKYRGN